MNTLFGYRKNKYFEFNTQIDIAMSFEVNLLKKNELVVAQKFQVYDKNCFATTFVSNTLF